MSKTTWTTRATEIVTRRIRSDADVLAIHLGHCATNPAQWNDPIYAERLAAMVRLGQRLAARAAR